MRRPLARPLLPLPAAIGAAFAAALATGARPAAAEEAAPPPPAPGAEATVPPTEAPAAEPPAPPATPAAPGPALTPVGLGVDLIPGVGTSKTWRGADRRSLSVGGITWSGEVDGVELTVIGGLIAGDLSGGQAGLAGLVGGDVQGVQAAAFGTFAGGEVDGAQLAGGANIAGGRVDGLQAAGGGNLSAGGVDGYQLAGGGNLAVDGVRGLQAAGAANLARGGVDGAQIAGGVNLADEVDGAQIGTVNVASGDVDGVQIGLINIARNSDASIGLINVITEGRTHVDLWQAESGYGQIALKHGGRYLHNLYGVGYRPWGPCPEWSVLLGIGGHSPVGKRLFVDTDLIAQHISPAGGLLVATNELLTARAVLGVKLVDRLALTAGLSGNALLSTVQDGSQYADGAWAGFHTVSEDGLHTRGWSGWTVGVQLF